MNRFEIRNTILKKLKLKNPDESWDFLFMLMYIIWDEKISEENYLSQRYCGVIEKKRLSKS